MPVSIEVPGLDAFAPEVPDGRLVILEGGPDPAKSHLARRLATSSAQGGRDVQLWATAPGQSPLDVGDVAAREVETWPEEWPDGHDVVVDSFSLLATELAAGEVADRLRAIRRSCGRSGTVAVLVLDDGQLAPGPLSVTHHFADGIMQFHSRDDADGPVNFLRIPKWMGRAGLGKNLYYGFDGENILIDTRRRVN